MNPQNKANQSHCSNLSPLDLLWQLFMIVIILARRVPLGNWQDGVRANMGMGMVIESAPGAQNVKVINLPPIHTPYLRPTQF